MSRELANITLTCPHRLLCPLCAAGIVGPFALGLRAAETGRGRNRARAIGGADVLEELRRALDRFGVVVSVGPHRTFGLWLPGVGRVFVRVPWPSRHGKNKPAVFMYGQFYPSGDLRVQPQRQTRGLGRLDLSTLPAVQLVQ